MTCAPEVLLTRVANASRTVYGKISDPTMLAGMMHRYDLFGAVPFGESLTVDTTQTQPIDAARRIVTHYSLPTISVSGQDEEPGMSR